MREILLMQHTKSLADHLLLVSYRYPVSIYRNPIGTITTVRYSRESQTLCFPVPWDFNCPHNQQTETGKHILSTCCNYIYCKLLWLFSVDNKVYSWSDITAWQALWLIHCHLQLRNLSIHAQCHRRWFALSPLIQVLRYRWPVIIFGEVTKCMD